MLLELAGNLALTIFYDPHSLVRDELRERLGKQPCLLQQSPGSVASAGAAKEWVHWVDGNF